MSEPTAEETLQNLAKAVIEGNAELANQAAQHALRLGMDPYEGIANGLSAGMGVVGRYFENGIYFVPDLIMSAQAMYTGIDILKPHIKLDAMHTQGTVVIGTVRGDIHDIGKNLVKIMLTANGFEVHDLGRNVPFEAYLEKAAAVHADIIGMSALMATTMLGMERVVTMVKDTFPDGSVRTMIGGAPVSATFAQRIGADAYADDAVKAIAVARQLVAAKVAG